MKDTIKELNRRYQIIAAELKDINDAIESLQKVCTHKTEDGKDAYEHEGHDSHKDYYVCSICGDSYSI